MSNKSSIVGYITILIITGIASALVTALLMNILAGWAREAAHRSY